MARSRLGNLARMLMIGQGVAALTKPLRNSGFRSAKRNSYRNMFHKQQKRSMLSRALGVAGAGLGVWWAMRQSGR